MKSLKKIFLILMLALYSCGEDEQPQINDCPTELACTTEFVMLTFTPRTNGEFIRLDSHYTQNLDNGETYNFDALVDATSNPGYYIIATDAQMEEIQKEGTNLRFIGIKNSQVFIEQDFVVGHDCCHVIPLEGPFGDL